MTEAEWLSSTDVAPLLAFADRVASRRRSHLFALAWVERHRNVLSSRAAWVFDVVRRRADGEDDPDVRDRAAGVAWEEYTRAVGRWGREWATATHMLWRLLIPPNEPWGYRGPSAALELCRCVYRNLASSEEEQAAVAAERRAVLPLARDILGNPFRPVALDPRWRTEDTLALARGIYDEREWDRLPVLSDALMDAGCDDELVLAHCRGDAPHVRGCWVVDLVLGKE